MILVVDDDPVNVEIVKRKLQDLGYTIITAGDGEAALKILQMQVPQLIILDVQMPNMNGHTFILKKTAVVDFVSIPVIMLTANNDVQPLFKRHGVKAYLTKPLKLQDLLDTVAKIIGPA